MATHTFHHDPTHGNPLTPASLEFLVNHHGLETVAVLRLHPYPEEARLPGNDPVTERLNAMTCGGQDFRRGGEEDAALIESWAKFVGATARLLNRTMRILVTASHAPFLHGGGERHVDNLCAALRARGHDVALLRLPFKFSPEADIERLMAFCDGYDLSAPNGQHVDRVISLQFPGYGMRHPQHVVWLMHQHRAVYELFDPDEATPALRRAAREDRRLRPAGTVGRDAHLRQFAPRRGAPAALQRPRIDAALPSAARTPSSCAAAKRGVTCSSRAAWNR